MAQKEISVNIDKRVINSCYRPYIDDSTRLQIFYGGSSSGKSYFLAQRVVIDMLKGGHNYLCVRKVAKTVSRSIFNEICKAISSFSVSKFFQINKSDYVITGPNGYQILFAGLDDVEKIKSITPAKGVITDIWVEESTETEQDDIKQLSKRLRGKSKVAKRVILSFNPIYQTHWIYREYFAGRWQDDSKTYKDDHMTILKTTYRDNEFLEPDDIYELEHEADPYWKAVYTDGNWGVLGKAIFTNWHIADLADIEFPDYINGLDFGYANDPAALSRCHFDRRKNTLYVVDARYMFEYTNDVLAAEIKNVIGREMVVCDSAEPKSIAELRRYGVTAVAAKKGRDSINYGIQWLQQVTIVVDKRLTELINELTVYRWREDKDGNIIPKPIDKDNHILDSIRYATEIDSGWTGNTYSKDLKIPLAGAL